MSDNAYRARAAELSAGLGETRDGKRVPRGMRRLKDLHRADDHFRHLVNQRRIARATMNDGIRR
jgi:hypothetical protein